MIIGAIAGDMIGSTREWENVKSKEFDLFEKDSHFTDDSVMTIATADALLTNKSYTHSYKLWGNLYPEAGYGASFKKWLASPLVTPYGSWGNGSAMRISPIAYISHKLAVIQIESVLSAKVTHDHPEGIKGAQAAATAIYLAKHGFDKSAIKAIIQDQFKYNLDRKLDDIRPDYKFDVSCQGSVPEAIIAFLEGQDFEDSVRGAVSIGGDSDTIASITGAIAEAYYGGVPQAIVGEVMERLDEPMKKVIVDFTSRFQKIT